MSIRKLHLPALCLLLVLLATAVSSAAPLVKTLPNGLRVIVERFPAAPVAAVRLFVQTGSVYEGRFAGCGLSHLVEHSVEHGSALYTADQIRSVFGELGESRNAFTSQDDTWYVITTPAAGAEEALRVTADMVLAPLLTDEAVEEEKGVILHEMQMDEDEPNRVLWDVFNSTLLLQHPARLPIAGFRDQFTKLTGADARAYHRARYAPENVIAVVVGDFDAAAMMAQAEKILAAYPARATLPTPLPQEPPVLSRREAVREQPGLTRSRLLLGWHSVSLFENDMYPLDLLAGVLGRGETSRLGSRLQVRDKLVDQVWCGDDTPPYDPGAFVIGATFAPEKEAQVRAALLEEIVRVRDRGVTAEELARVRRQVRADKVFSSQTAEGRADALGSDLLLTGDVDFTTHYLERMDRVTPAQVQAAARKYLDPAVYTLALLRPPAAPATTVGSATPAAVSSSTRVVLSNGLRVILTSRPGSGAVQMLTATAAGLRLEPTGQAGLSSFTAEMLTRGAQGETREALARTLEDHGATLSAYSGRNSVGLSGQALTEDADLLASRLANCLLRPAFPDTEIESLRQDVLASIAAQEEDPFYVGELLLGESVFPQHPYRNPQTGTAPSVKSLQRANLVDFHRAVFSPKGTVLVISGDLTREAGLHLAQKYFGGWQAAGQAPAAPALDPPLTAPVAQETERPQAQAMVLYGWRGPRLTDPDLPVWEVLFGVLNSQSPTGPVFPPLRQAGLAYVAGAGLIPGLDPGEALLYAATDAATVPQVRAGLDAAVRRLQDQPLSAETLAQTQQSLVASQALGLADPEAMDRSQALDELYGLGYEHYLRYPEDIRQVTAAQVQTLARATLDMTHSVVVVTRPVAKK
ncbi:MAG TPA: pitrilysin family protein [Armatimonadota bacterium]|jgi:zinc protease